VRTARIAFAAVACSCVLSGCGTSHVSGGPYVASSNCTVRATNVDLAGCDLSHRDLTDLDLASENLRRADLEGADLDGADLQGADVRGADLRDVRTNASTICVNARFGPCSRPALRGA
jgi:uncharacterized protein YjbI with pentapeptide repeats